MGGKLYHTPGHIDCPACDGATKVDAITISGNMPFEEAFNRWIETKTIRRAGVVTNARYLTDRGIADLKQYARMAGRFFGKIPLEKIHAGHLMTYQQARAVCDNSVITDGAGWTSPAGANLIIKEVQLVRRLMRLADCWDEDKMARTWQPLTLVVNDVPRALTPREQELWLETAASRPEWQTIYWYSLVGLQTTCSSNELRGFRLGDIFLDQGIIEVRAASAKNSYRKRTIPLETETVVWAFSKLLERAAERGARDPFHYLFPRHVTFDRYDPRVPMTVSGIKKPWNAVRQASGLRWFRIYDLRHTAITRMAEAGLPITIIMQFAGHISRAMQEHYTHISMQAKRRWAATAFAGGELPYAPSPAYALTPARPAGQPSSPWQSPAVINAPGMDRAREARKQLRG